jgi:glucose/arabinose dehydrogenase
MRRAALLLTLTALVLPACGGDGDPGGSGSPAPTSDAPRATATVPSASATAPQAGASLTPRPALSGPPKLVKVGDFESPTFVTAPPDDPRLLVLEKAGRIKVVPAGGGVSRTPYLDIVGMVSDEGERGLLSLAFPPDHATSRKAYVLYTANDGDLTLVEYRAVTDGSRLDPASRRVVLEIPHPRSNHNGGTIGFDPSGMLLWSTGDGGGANDPDDNAQDLSSLLGKVLRLDVARSDGTRPYAVPADNPFVEVSGARPEIYAYGLRNPWRWSLDRSTFYLGDVGQYVIEELDAVPLAQLKGANFGWPAFEGRRRTRKPAPAGPGRLVEPVLTYDHDDGGCAVTAGVVYRGAVTSLREQYLYADFCQGEVLAVPPARRDTRPTRTGLKTDQLSSFGTDAYGDAYVVSLSGPVFRISA